MWCWWLIFDVNLLLTLDVDDVTCRQHPNLVTNTFHLQHPSPTSMWPESCALKFQIGSSISSERTKIRNLLDKLSKYTAQLLTYFVNENWSRKRHKSSNQNTAKSEMGCEWILIEREQTCFIVIELVSFWFCIISTYHVFIVFDINFISQRNIIL